MASKKDKMEEKKMTSKKKDETKVVTKSIPKKTENKTMEEKEIKNENVESEKKDIANSENKPSENEEKKTTTEAPIEKKKIVTKIIPKEVAVVNGYSLKISTKDSIAICKMIMRKSPAVAIGMLEMVLDKKMAVPMTMSEVPHRKRSLIPGNVGGGGRFPRNASIEFINLLEQLNANCNVNGVENPVITLAVSNLASRPMRRERRRAKRTNVHIEARDKTKLKKEKK